MIIIDSHGLYPPDEPDEEDLTWVPSGVEVWFYTDEGTMLSSAHAMTMLANLPDLPPPLDRLPEGTPIYNHVLNPHGAYTVAARRTVIPEGQQDKVVYDVGLNTPLCSDPLGLCRRPPGAAGPLVHRCRDSVFGRFRSAKPLVLLICRGDSLDDNSDSYNENVPPPAALWSPEYSEGTKAFRAATTDSDRLSAFLRRLWAAARLAQDEGEGEYAACLRMGGYREPYTAPRNFKPGEHPKAATALAELEAVRLRVAGWMAEFEDAGLDERIVKVLELPAHQVRHVVALNDEVGKAVRDHRIAVEVARAIPRHEGSLTLLLHYRSASELARASMDDDDELAPALREAERVLAAFQAGDHAHRLTTWVSLPSAQRTALRELVWLPDKLSEQARAWIREAQKVLKDIRVHLRSGSTFAVLHHTRNQDPSWDRLWEADAKISEARDLGLAHLSAFEEGGDDERVLWWDRYSAEDQRLLTRLSPTVHRWARHEDVVRAQAAAALAAGGELGLLAFLRQPGEDWRCEVPLPTELRAARRHAELRVRQFDAAAPDIDSVTEAAVDAWLAHSPQDRKRLSSLSSGARHIEAAIDVFDQELFGSWHAGTPNRLWTFWEVNTAFHKMVRANPGKYRRVLARVERAGKVVTEILPFLARLSDEALLIEYRDLADARRAEVDPEDTALGQRLAALLEPSTSDDEFWVDISDGSSDTDDSPGGSDVDSSDADGSAESDGNGVAPVWARTGAPSAVAAAVGAATLDDIAAVASAQPHPSDADNLYRLLREGAPSTGEQRRRR